MKENNRMPYVQWDLNELLATAENELGSWKIWDKQEEINSILDSGRNTRKKKLEEENLIEIL